MTFSAVLWDMDGTLIDSEPIWGESQRQLMNRFGYIWTQDDQEHCLGGPLSRVGHYMKMKANSDRSADFFVQELVKLQSINISGNVEFVDGAYKLLEEISILGIPMALVSASPRILVSAALVRVPAHALVTSIAAEDVTHIKPHPEAYMLGAERLGVALENALIIEDSHTGVSAGLASGGYVLALGGPYESHPRLRTVESLATLDFNAICRLWRDDESTVR
jgi:beta-phosphoglucomutase-like phosphatase (HAD superfamily)